MKLYLAVTADRYELPVGLFDSLKELSQHYGMTSKCMNSYIYRGCARKKENIKFIKVEID